MLLNHSTPSDSHKSLTRIYYLTTSIRMEVEDVGLTHTDDTKMLRKVYAEAA